MNLPMYLAGWTLILVQLGHPIPAAICAASAIIAAMYDFEA